MEIQNVFNETVLFILSPIYFLTKYVYHGTKNIMALNHFTVDSSRKSLRGLDKD